VGRCLQYLPNLSGLHHAPTCQAAAPNTTNGLSTGGDIWGHSRDCGGGVCRGSRLPRFSARGHKSHRHDIPSHYPQVAAWHVVGWLGLVNAPCQSKQASRHTRTTETSNTTPTPPLKKPCQLHRNLQPLPNPETPTKKKAKQAMHDGRGRLGVAPG
jgi:hypothetical protein